jgi:hypothetical protein
MTTLPEPRGCTTPATFPMPPIYGAGIIPPAHPIPARAKSFEISPDLFAPGPPDAAIAEAMEKLRLEDERMRRILPALPAGYSWRGEIESRQHLDFTHDRGDVTMRLVYRIHDRNGERMDGTTAAMLWAREKPAE